MAASTSNVMTESLADAALALCTPIKLQRKRRRSATQPSSDGPTIYCNPPWLPHKPVHCSRPHTLLLGSMTAAAGLRAKRYYAHPQNQFYPIMSALLSYDITLPNADQVDIILANGIMLWNVLASCQRVGSLDSAIRRPVGNNIAQLLQRFPTVRTIGLNGGYAYKYFHHTLCREQPDIQSLIDNGSLRTVKLISSSPAAAMPNAIRTKTQQWKTALQIGNTTHNNTDEREQDGEDEQSFTCITRV